MDICVDRGPYPWEGLCVCLRPGPMGSGGSVAAEGMCELRLVSAYVWEVGP